VRAEVDGVVVGLALLNRRRGRLFLSESGDARLDAPFIEHNAPLIAEGAPASVLPAMMHAAWRSGWVWGMTLSGVPPEVVAAAGGLAWRRQERVAPYVDLDAVRAAGGDYLATLSANTRQQIRRSLRAYAARGEVRLERAETAEAALACFEEMMRLHGEAWRRRGKPGAFADAFALRFHRALITRGAMRREVDLLRGTAGNETFGILYNFRHRGRVCAYQGGWQLTAGSSADRPGIVLHVLAVADALRSGASEYDLLAGAARYKTSIANARRRLHWTTAVPLGWRRRGAIPGD
jgi:CelD/BcsL family acetyltransferase involved in cellulose biosynthesis